MDIKILKDDKNELKVQLENLTVIEILRVYLNKDNSVGFAAWKREHPSKNPILHIKTKGKTAKKALQDAITAVEKDTTKFLKEFKKAK
jgi:DNA-directed RNA polymerase subunit L